tara:strand:+ start:242 stop:478 length:237 start_codon:yes stop_codon:yes gene_type:complete
MKKGPFRMAGMSFKGESPVKNKPEPYYDVKDVSNDLTETGRGVDVTKEYEKKGNKETRKHIASGGKVYKRADGSFVLI